MLQRFSQSRLLVGLVCAVVAAVVASGVSAAVVGGAKAESDTVTMCISALGTKVRFVHRAADCTSGELVQTWNVEGPAGPRGLRGNTGATGPAGPAGPSGPAGLAASIFGGGAVIDAAISVPWYVNAGVTPSTVTLVSTTFTVPTSARQYFVYWTTTEAIPNATAGCTDNASNVTPTVQVTVNGSVSAIPEATLTPLVLQAGTNIITVQAAQGRCTAGTAEAGGASDVTLRRLSVIFA
jgi:hypothetical protein